MEKHPLQINPYLQAEICLNLSFEEAANLLDALGVAKLDCPYPFVDVYGKKIVLPNISKETIAVYREIQSNGLQEAFIRSIQNGNVEMMESLIKLGAKVSGNSLYLAVLHNQSKIVQKLIERGINVNDKEYYSAFLTAINEGRSDIIKIFLDAGANINGVTPGNFPLTNAIIHKQPESVRTLLEYPNQKIDLNASSEFGSALRAAVKIGNVPIFELLYNAGAKADGREDTLLLDAIHQGKEKMVKLLLNPIYKQDLNFIDPYDFTPLTYAIINNRINLVKLLLEAGADPNLVTPRGTPFEFAKRVGSQARIIDLLKSFGAH